MWAWIPRGLILCAGASLWTNFLGIDVQLRASSEFRKAWFYAQARHFGPICSEMVSTWGQDLKIPASRHEFCEAWFYAQARHFGPIGSELTSIFNKNSEKAPHGSTTRFKGAHGHPKGSQNQPKVVPRDAKGNQTTPKAIQRDKVYISKLPINRLSGRYVNNINNYNNNNNNTNINNISNNNEHSYE